MQPLAMSAACCRRAGASGGPRLAHAGAPPLQRRSFRGQPSHPSELRLRVINRPARHRPILASRRRSRAPTTRSATRGDGGGGGGGWGQCKAVQPPPPAARCRDTRASACARGERKRVSAPRDRCAPARRGRGGAHVALPIHTRVSANSRVMKIESVSARLAARGYNALQDWPPFERDRIFSLEFASKGMSLINPCLSIHASGSLEFRIQERKCA